MIWPRPWVEPIPIFLSQRGDLGTAPSDEPRRVDGVSTGYLNWRRIPLV